MKYCQNCGSQIADDAAFCPRCGAPVKSDQPVKSGPTTLQTIAEVFMVLGCISSGWLLIPLCWTIPMTVSYFNKVKARQKVGVGLKICTLLFVSLIAGILMLCDDSGN